MEIKFITYRKLKKCWVLEDDMAILGYGDKMRYDVDDESWKRVYYGDTKYFQTCLFTGLHDKNGNELYEGHIFRYTEHEGYNLKSFVSVVEYFPEHACFGFRKDNIILYFSHIDELQKDFLDHIEIIGTKFENPELLENELQ